MRKLTKKEIQLRIIDKNTNEVISLNKFKFEKKNKTIIAGDDLLFNFDGLEGFTFITGDRCNFKTGGFCNFNTGSYCYFETYDFCDFETGIACNFITNHNCFFRTGRHCNFITYNNCFFYTGSYCDFKTGCGCDFKTGCGCNFNILSNCVIIYRYDDILKNTIDTVGNIEYTKIQLPYGTNEGYIENDLYNKNGRKSVYFDQKIVDFSIKKEFKGFEIYKIKNGYVIKKGTKTQNGETLKDCFEYFKKTILNLNIFDYRKYKLNTILPYEEIFILYRMITKIREYDLTKFLKTIKLKKEYSIQEVIDITKGQYGNCVFKKFFEKKLE